MNKFLENLNSIDKKIKEDFEIKNKIITTFIESITETCNIFYDLWKNAEIEKRINNLETKYNYTLQRGGYDELTLHNVIRTLANKFPIYNDEQDHIIDNLPRVNEQWSFENKSNDKEINIEVTPIDIYSRYPTDPDNNPMVFNYIIDIEVHKKIENQEFKYKEKIITQYFKEVTDNYLNKIEKIIQSKSQIIKTALKDVDFNNPEIVEELKRKLNSI